MYEEDYYMGVVKHLVNKHQNNIDLQQYFNLVDYVAFDITLGFTAQWLRDKDKDNWWV